MTEQQEENLKEALKDISNYFKEKNITPEMMLGIFSEEMKQYVEAKRFNSGGIITERKNDER